MQLVAAPPLPPPAPRPLRPRGSRTGVAGYADCEDGFRRLASDVVGLADRITFFDERSSVPAEMATWPVAHQQALADNAATALADPLDELLERSLDVASDVRALDRLLGGRAHDEESLEAIEAIRADLDRLRHDLARIRARFAGLAADFGALSGTADQLAKVACIVDATDAVAGSWQPNTREPERLASGHP